MKKQQKHIDWGQREPPLSIQRVKNVFFLTGGSAVAITLTRLIQSNLFVKIVSVPRRKVLTAEKLFLTNNHIILKQP